MSGTASRALLQMARIAVYPALCYFPGWFFIPEFRIKKILFCLSTLLSVFVRQLDRVSYSLSSLSSFLYIHTVHFFLNLIALLACLATDDRRHWWIKQSGPENLDCAPMVLELSTVSLSRPDAPIGSVDTGTRTAETRQPQTHKHTSVHGREPERRGKTAQSLAVGERVKSKAAWGKRERERASDHYITVTSSHFFHHTPEVGTSGMGRCVTLKNSKVFVHPLDLLISHSCNVVSDLALF